MDSIFKMADFVLFEPCSIIITYYDIQYSNSEFWLGISSSNSLLNDDYSRIRQSYLYYRLDCVRMDLFLFIILNSWLPFASSTQQVDMPYSKNFGFNFWYRSTTSFIFFSCIQFLSFISLRINNVLILFSSSTAFYTS